jgi:type III pantothenate kinase
MKLAALDVGNSNVVLGLFENGELIGHWRFRTHPDRTADEYAVLFRQSCMTSAGNTSGYMADALVMGTVVPALRQVMWQVTRNVFGCEPLDVTPAMDEGMPFDYQSNTELGTDRFLNALAARERYGSPCIVADFGTASKFDVVSPDGRYIGGAIAPGMGISMDALSRSAPRLPHVDLRAPQRAIGRGTVECMQSGFFYGFVGQTEAIIGRIREELGTDARVIATGGLAHLIAGHTAYIEMVDPWLTLQGLRLAWEKIASSA